MCVCMLVIRCVYEYVRVYGVKSWYVGACMPVIGCVDSMYMCMD